MSRNLVHQMKSPFMLALVFSGLGLELIFGATELILLIGSLLCVFFGLAIILVAWLSRNSDSKAVVLYQSILITAIPWPIWEVGFEVWCLFPAIVAPTVLTGFFIVWISAKAPTRGVQYW